MSDTKLLTPEEIKEKIEEIRVRLESRNTPSKWSDFWLKTPDDMEFLFDKLQAEQQKNADFKATIEQKDAIFALQNDICKSLERDNEAKAAGNKELIGEVTTLREALERLTRDEAITGGRPIKGNDALPDPAGEFYKGYNAGIDVAFKKSSGIASAALGKDTKPAPKPFYRAGVLADSIESAASVEDYRSEDCYEGVHVDCTFRRGGPCKCNCHTAELVETILAGATASKQPATETGADQEEPEYVPMKPKRSFTVGLKQVSVDPKPDPGSAPKGPGPNGINALTTDQINNLVWKAGATQSAMRLGSALILSQSQLTAATARAEKAEALLELYNLGLKMRPGEMLEENVQLKQALTSAREDRDSHQREAIRLMEERRQLLERIEGLKSKGGGAANSAWNYAIDRVLSLFDSIGTQE